MNPEVKEWLELAITDFGVAKHLNDTYYPKPIEIICYHCQQSAEKAIKALIVHFGAVGGLPKSHDLSFWLNQIKNMVEISEDYYDCADALTPYGVAIRYPNDLSLNEKHATDAIMCAEKILTWVKDIL